MTGTRSSLTSPQRSSRLRRIGGYGAALAMTPYLIMKVLWTFGLLLPTAELGSAEWRAVNAATVAVAAIGIGLALACCRPWGERLPASLIALPVWIGTGLLVPMVLLAPILAPAAILRDQAAGAADVWIYEQILVIVSLIGAGAGLPLALAGYVRARWPTVVSGPLSRPTMPESTRDLQISLGRLAAVGCLALGTAKVYWAAGGSIGLDQAQLAERDLWWHALSLSTGAWSLAGAWSVLVLTEGRGARQFLPPMVVAWVSSGMLFAYSLFFALRPDSAYAPEHPVAQVITTEAGVVLGLVMGLTILLVLHDRDRASRTQPARTSDARL
ncbi:hypothetical protein JQS43_07785 [Natronosporangium hydrolyticum]|uniref:Uncharacterized protein n=1 Tax=Natronosporangium hydrolyticum TaxID=2811111 RepID=A0A895YL14_9ACTN|nr:hypothetical protein [Natronosporangium hydrolyticum]QSB16189.1 hypothetical protein JQS43_07785 [Natronosporangium hydrolyticum]